MTANVNQEQCIGCGLCVGMAPEIFRMNDNGLSEAFGDVTEANKEVAVDAANSCPVAAITVE